MMTEENNGSARAALDANLARTRHVIALQIAVENHQRTLGLTHEVIQRLVRGHIDTLPRTEDPEYRLNLIRDILVAETTFQALTLRANDLFAAIQKVAPVQLVPALTS